MLKLVMIVFCFFHSVMHEPPHPRVPSFFFVFDLLLELHVYKCPCYLCGVQQSHNEGNRY